jgi:hypothetical protein
MKTSKLLKRLETSIDKLYDALYAVRDVFDDVEDEEIDFTINSFIEQVEICITEGDTNVSDVRDQISELPEE